MAEPARRLPDTRKPTPLRVVRGGDRDERERENLTLSSPPTTTPRVSARPRARDVLLGRWLRDRLGTVGGEAMVRRFGARAVLDALYDGVVCDEPVYDNEIVEVGTWADGSSKTGTRRVEVGRIRVVSTALKNPGGYLRWVLEQERER